MTWNLGKPWTTADDQTLNAMFNDDKTCREIGEAIGRSTASVGQRMSVIGLRRDPQFAKDKASAFAQRIAEARIAEKMERLNLSVQRIHEGKAVAEIAIEIGCSYYTVMDYLREAGVSATYRRTELGRPASRRREESARAKIERAAAKRKAEPKPKPPRKAKLDLPQKPYKPCKQPKRGGPLLVADVTPMNAIILAAQRLGRHYRPVVRHDIETATQRDLLKPAEKYRVGRMVLTPDEMLALADTLEDQRGGL